MIMWRVQPIYNFKEKTNVEKHSCDVKLQVAFILISGIRVHCTLYYVTNNINIKINWPFCHFLMQSEIPAITTAITTINMPRTTGIKRLSSVHYIHYECQACYIDMYTLHTDVYMYLKEKPNLQTSGCRNSTNCP